MSFNVGDTPLKSLSKNLFLGEPDRYEENYRQNDGRTDGPQS